MAAGFQCDRCKKFINTDLEGDDHSCCYTFIVKDSHRRFSPEFHLCPSCYHELKYKFLNNTETDIALKSPDLNSVCEKISGYELDPSDPVVPSDPVCSSEMNYLANKEILETNCDNILNKLSHMANKLH